MTIEKMQVIRHLWAEKAGMADIIARFVSQAVDFVFPPRCLVCGSWPENASPLLCSQCAALVDRERLAPACPTCAATVAPYEVSNGRCASCRNRRLPVQGTARVGPYAGHLGHLVRSYKYRAREELEPILGDWLAQVVSRASWLDRVEAVVSVPTHWRHRLSRPLYAADALASVVARQTGLPHPPILRRVRAGRHQIGLNVAERARNVRGAFAVRRGVTLHGARLLLIDDVKTTGATINECAKALRRAGAAEVYAAVVVTVLWDRALGQVLSSI